MVVTTTNKSRVKTGSNTWSRFKQIQAYTSTGWRTVKASYVWKIVNGVGRWVQWWPSSGPIALTDPHINKSSSSTTRLSGVVRIGTYSGGTYTAQKLYGHNGTWDGNGNSITSYKYYWRRAATEVAEDMVSFKNGTYSASADTEITLNSIYYDKKYMDFEIDALTADPDILGQAYSSDTDGFIYVIKNKPTLNGTPSFDQSSYSVGETITYTGDWRFELGYVPESARAEIKWYKTTGTVFDPSDSNAILITNGSDGYSISTDITENSLQYTVISSINGLEDGYSYFIVDTQYNSGSDYDLGLTNGVSSITSVGGVAGKPNPPGVPATAYSISADSVRFYFTPSIVDASHPKPVAYEWVVTNYSSSVADSVTGTLVFANNPDNQTYYVDYPITTDGLYSSWYFSCRALTTYSNRSIYAGPQVATIQTGLTPTFGAFTGYSTSEMRGTITNYDSNYNWTITSSHGSYSQLSVVGSTLTFAVTGLIPGQETTILAKTSRAGYRDAQAQKVGAALYAGLFPTFGNNTGTNTGFSGSITNYNSNWTWDWTVTDTSKGSTGGVSFSPPSGSTYSFTVYGLKYGESATLNVTTKRVGYQDGVGSTTGTALDPNYIVPNLVGTLASPVEGEYTLTELATTKTTDMSLTNKVASQSPVGGTIKKQSDLPINISISKYEYDSTTWYEYYSICGFNGYYSQQPTQLTTGQYFSDGSNLPDWPNGSAGTSVYTVTDVGGQQYRKYAWAKTQSAAASAVLNSSCVVPYTIPNFVGGYAPADTSDYHIAYTTTTKTSDMGLTNKIASQSPTGGTIVNAANKPITITVSLYNYDAGTTWYKGYSACLFSGTYSQVPTVIATGTYFADGSNLPAWSDGSAGTSDFTTTNVGDMTTSKYAWRTSSASALSAVTNGSCTIAPFFPPYFVPPTFEAPPFFPPYFVPPTFKAPPFFPPYFPPFFPPFFPPYFVPPTFKAAPFFPPYFVPPTFCIDEFTLVNTVSGYIMAKDIKVGDLVFTADIINDKIQLKTSAITNIEITESDDIVYFNQNTGVKFTSTEDLVVLTDGGYVTRKAQDIIIGDIVMSNSHGNICEMAVESIHTETSTRNVYNFAPAGIILTQSVLVDHRK